MVLEYAHLNIKSRPKSPSDVGKYTSTMGCIWVMWLKQCHKLAMTGNGKFIPPIKMVMTGGWFIVVLTTLMVKYGNINRINMGI